MWDWAEAEQITVKSGSKQNMKPHLSLFLSDLLESHPKNTHKYILIQMSKWSDLFSILHTLILTKWTTNTTTLTGESRSYREECSEWETEGFPTCEKWNTRVEWGRMRKRELFGGLIPIQASSRDRREKQGVGDWPSSTLTYIQMYPGLEIRVKSKVGGPQARTQAWVCMANVGSVPGGLTAGNSGGVWRWRWRWGDDSSERLHVLHC